MPGSAGATQHIRQTRHLNPGLFGLRLGIHHPYRRRKQQVGAFGRKHRGIAFQRARIIVEILSRTKLQRIDEDTGHHPVGDLVRGFDQRQVPGVQIAHRRHEGYIASSPPRFDLGAQTVDFASRDHQNACPAAGKAPSLTACT